MLSIKWPRCILRLHPSFEKAFNKNDEYILQLLSNNVCVTTNILSKVRIMDWKVISDDITEICPSLHNCRNVSFF